MKKASFVLLSILLLKIILHYLLILPGYELHRDEYLHLDQGRHLAWGYISVPPVTSWFSWIIRLLGNSEFLVKLVPALFGALTIFVVWKIAEEIKGGLFACVLASLAVLFSVVLRINMLYQPSSFDVFFWTLIYYVLIRYIHTQKPLWLYAAAISFAFGFLCKYNIVFLAAGLLPAVLLTSLRRMFAEKHFYFALLLALVIVSPNLLWQYQNHFPTAAQLKELAQTQLVNVDRSGFLKDQVLFFLSSVFVLLAAFVGLLIYPPFRPYRFLLISFVVSMFLFLYFQAKNYYAVGLYPALLSFGAVYLEKVFSVGWRRYFRPAAMALLLVLSVPFVLLAFPIHTPAYYGSHQQPYKDMGILRWEDGKDHLLPQDYADMIGWKELAKKTDSVYRLLPPNEVTLVLCDNYGHAGAINYYSSVPGMNAVSFNADYVNWFRLQRPVKNAILVKDVYDKDTGRQEEKPLFETVSLMGQIENPYAREKGTRIYLLRGAKTDINLRVQEEIERKKAAYTLK